MIEQRFWKYKTAVTGAMMGCGVVLMILAVAAGIFGVVFAVKLNVQKPTPTLEMTAGKTFHQKLPEPVPGAPMAIVFDNSIATELHGVGPQAKQATLPNFEPLLFNVDLTGGATDSNGVKIATSTNKTTFSIDRPRLERSSSATQWRLVDDDVVKFAKFYPEFLKKQPPDTVAADNVEKSGIGYHYAWVFFFWGAIALGIAILLRRWDPDLY